MSGKSSGTQKSNNKIIKVLIWIGLMLLCALIQTTIKNHASIIHETLPSDANAVSVALLSGIGTTLLYAVGIFLAIFFCRLLDKHKRGVDNNKSDFDTSALNISKQKADSETGHADKASEFKQKNLQIEKESENNPKYGLEANSPIFVNGKCNKKQYLDHLCTEEGEALFFRYKNSILTKNICGFVEQYGAYRMNGSLYGTIFISVYGTHNSTNAPEGYQLNTSYDNSKNDVDVAVEGTRST